MDLSRESRKHFPGTLTPSTLPLLSAPYLGSCLLLLSTKALPRLASSLQPGLSILPSFIQVCDCLHEAGASGPQGRGRAEPLTGSSPTVALIKDNQTFHGAKINLWLFSVLHLIMLRLSGTFSALSHCTEVPFLLPEPGSWRGPEKDAAP